MTTAHRIAAGAGGLVLSWLALGALALGPAAPAAARQPGPPAGEKQPAGEKPAAVSSSPVLKLVPLTGTPIELAAGDLAKLPHQTVQVPYPSGPEHQTHPAELSGVPLRALLDRLGVPSGHDVHGDALRLYVLAEGADGYRVVLALAELDPSFTDSRVLVADRRDGRPLDATEGPLRLIVPMDRRPARWVRQLVRITVQRAP